MHVRPVLNIGISVIILLYSLSIIGLQTVESATKKEEQETLAELIAYSGHGYLFDKNQKQIRLDDELVIAMQDSMVEALLKAEDMELKEETIELVEKAYEFIRFKELELHEAVLLRNAVVSRLILEATPRLKARFEWRHRIFFSRTVRWIYPEISLRPEILEWVEVLSIFDYLEWILSEGSNTDYMDDCHAHKVPIPPDWAQTGTAWVRQGSLTQNLLVPGEHAEVWTYTDPNNRGACVALPRGSGAVGSAAGIICQSATTGHACFWDNKLRGVPEQFIGWQGKRLEIKKLKDGSNLNDNCTRCHRGNNVYLISPDDPTWAKLLRGPLSSTPGSKFTTVVENSSDNRGGHPRYIPISTLPERPGWQNGLPGPGCAGACHETPAINDGPPALRMAPACANPSVADCYQP